MSEDAFLPYGRHWIAADDIDAVAKVLETNYLTTGPVAADFEKSLARKVNADYACVCSSGTAALHLMLLALRIGPGDHVVVPSMTFVATANAVRFVGAEVIFADVDSRTGLMEARHLREAIERNPKKNIRAFIAVHLNGQCAPIAELHEFAQENGLMFLEDACHALGTKYQVKNETFAIGSCAHSTCATFSFHPVKTIAMGEGGAVCTNDGEVAERLISLRSHGIVKSPGAFKNKTQAFDDTGSENFWYYEQHELGLNYRASDIHCALGRSQLKKLDGFVAKRKRLVSHYEASLAEMQEWIEPIARSSDCNPAWHLCAVLIDFVGIGIARNELMRRLRDRNIGSQVHYLPVHRQPYYEQRYGAATLMGADAYYQSVLSLPLFPGMEDEDVDRVVHALQAASAG